MVAQILGAAMVILHRLGSRPVGRPTVFLHIDVRELERVANLTRS
jgi:hypothetical protein